MSTKPSKEFLLLMKIADQMEDRCCQLWQGGLPLGCSQLTDNQAKTEAYRVMKMFVEEMTMMEYRWENSSNVPAYHVLKKIVNNEGVSMGERQAAVNNFEPRFAKVINKCKYIAILNGWSKW